MIYTTETFLRLSAQDAEGKTHTIDVPITTGRAHKDIFEVAHRNADGSLPSVDELGWGLWDHARRLRVAEDILKAAVKFQAVTL